MKMRLLIIAIFWGIAVAGCCSNTKISLCYDPDIVARDDYQELRVVDVFDSNHQFVDEILAYLKRHDFPEGDYSFCGVLCYVVCEENGVPACVAEILQDGNTVSMVVPFGSESGVVSKTDGSYIIKTALAPFVPRCYSIPELVEKVRCLLSDSFGEHQLTGSHPVPGFKKGGG